MQKICMKETQGKYHNIFLTVLTISKEEDLKLLKIIDSINIAFHKSLIIFKTLMKEALDHQLHLHNKKLYFNIRLAEKTKEQFIVVTITMLQELKRIKDCFNKKQD